MRARMIAFALMVLLTFLPNMPGDEPVADGKKVDAAHIRKLIEDLGSASYLEREQAGRDLEAIGPVAVGELRKAAANRDVEISTRAIRLADRLEEKALADSMVSGKRIRLKVTDMSVVAAVAELQKLSGQQIDLAGDKAPLLARKITLDTGEVTVWEALRHLCEKGGLIEQFSANRRNQPIMPFNQIQPVQQVPSQPGAIVLVEGTQKSLPTCFVGSVRVRALPANSAGNPLPGEVNVVLEVVGEPRLQNFGIVDALYFDRAVDDQGQRLEPLLESHFSPQSQYAMQNFQRVMIVNGNLVPFGGQNGQQQRTAVFRFKPGPKGGHVLKELSGKLVLQALSPVETLLNIKDVRKAVNASFNGRDGSTIQIQKVENLDKGALRLEVAMESLPEGDVMNPFGANVMVFNGNFNGNINGVQFVNGVPANQLPTNFPKLVDIKGKKYTAEVTNPRLESSNGMYVRHATLTYRPEAEANQLILEGQRTILFAVPIHFKDVPLH